MPKMLGCCPWGIPMGMDEIEVFEVAPVKTQMNNNNLKPYSKPYAEPNPNPNPYPKLKRT
jgi:hypothetical protein